MQAFEYASPPTKEEAVKLLLAGRPQGFSAVLAGGTDLLSLMKDHIETPARIVSIRSIRELQGLRYDAGQGLRIGAAVTIDEILDDPSVAREYPALRQAAERVASPQIRSMSTVGGNLCQRPRCWYYRNGFGLLARRGGRFLVLDGDNRYHAILGNAGPAFFVHASTLAPPLIALGATLRIFGPKGDREVALEEFYRIPRTEQEKEHTLAPDEIITDILVPPPASGSRSATYEVRQRLVLDWPLATASVALVIEEGIVRRARVVLGHVAPIPWASAEAGALLTTGLAPNEQIADKAAQAAVEPARALSRNAYKIRIARVTVKRAILRAMGQEV